MTMEIQVTEGCKARKRKLDYLKELGSQQVTFVIPLPEIQIQYRLNISILGLKIIITFIGLSYSVMRRGDSEVGVGVWKGGDRRSGVGAACPCRPSRRVPLTANWAVKTVCVP